MKIITNIILFIIALCITNYSNAQRISTIAGNGITGYTGDGNPAITGELTMPSGIAVKNGVVYIADAGAHVIRRVDTNGIITTVAGTGAPGYAGDNGPPVSATLNAPRGLAFDAAGDLYIADDQNLVIRKIDTAGTITTIAGNGSYGTSGDHGPAIYATLSGSIGIAIDRKNNIYISDGNSRVRKIDTFGIISTIAGNSTPGYTGDSGPDSLATLAGPAGLATDYAGNLYIADRRNNVIRKIDTFGIITTVAGNGAFAGTGYGGYNGDDIVATTAELNLPYGILADQWGNLFITDQGNEIIRKVSAAGIISSIAGNEGDAGYAGDGGSPANALLNTPAFMTMDTAANIYFADAGNYVARKIAPLTVTVTPGDTICAGTTVVFSAAATISGPGIKYQWQKNGINSGTDSSAYVASDVQNGDIISCNLFNNISGAIICTSDSINMIVEGTIPLSVSVSVNTGDTVCAGETAKYNVSAIGGTTPSFNWFVNHIYATSGPQLNYNPVNGDSIVCVATNTDACGTEYAANPPIGMTVLPLLTPSLIVINSGIADSVCPGASVTFTAIASIAGANPSYAWAVNGIHVPGTDSTYTYNPANSDTVACFVTSDEVCRSADSVAGDSIVVFTMPLISSSVAISIYGSDTVCMGSAAVLSASAVNGGSTPSFQWFVNGIATLTGDSLTYIPSNGDLVYCELTSSECSVPATVLSGTIKISTSPLVVPFISIIPDAVTVCSGTTVNFGATDTNGGTEPIFEWTVNGVNVAIENSYSYTPANGDVVSCLMISNAACAYPLTARSDSITMAVDPVTTPSVAISSVSGATSCAGTIITYTAAATYPGLSPVYQWKVNGINTTTGNSFSYAPANSDVITCILTSDAACITVNTAFSNSVTMTVNPLLTPSVNISASSGFPCAGTIVTYTANATNAGLSPIYQWLINGVYISASPFYSYIPANNDTVECLITSTAACPAPDTVSTALIIPVNPVVSPSISFSGSDPVCAGTSVSYTATPVNGGSTPAYQWRVNGSNTGTAAIYMYTPANGDIITCVITASAACATPDSAVSPAFTMTVNPILVPSVNISASSSASICTGTSVTYTATPAYGGVTPAYQWNVNGSLAGTGNTYTYVPLNADHITCRLSSNAICAVPDTAISAAITMSVSPVLIPSVTVAAESFTVCAGTLVTYTATPVNGGSAPAYQWQVNGINSGTGATHTYTPANGDNITCTLTSSAACASPDTAISDTVEMEVMANITPSVSITASPGTTVAALGASITFSATVTDGGPAAAYQWLINGIAIPGATGTIFTTDTFTTNDSITCVVTGNAPCTTGAVPSNTLGITVTVGVPQIYTAGHLQLMPNPNNGSFTISGKVEAANNEVAIAITDMLGHIVYRGKATLYQNEINERVVLNAQVPDGMYLLQVDTGGTHTILHFVLMK